MALLKNGGNGNGLKIFVLYSWYSSLLMSFIFHLLFGGY